MNRRQFINTTAVASLALASRAADPSAKFRVSVIGQTGRSGYRHGLDTMHPVMHQ